MSRSTSTRLETTVKPDNIKNFEKPQKQHNTTQPADFVVLLFCSALPTEIHQT